jgi:hypothetical protein
MTASAGAAETSLSAHRKSGANVRYPPKPDGGSPTMAIGYPVLSGSVIGMELPSPHPRVTGVDGRGTGEALVT